MHTQSLDGDGWTVRAVGDLSLVPDQIRGQIFPARVPGCVHLDLIRAGVLRHPNLGYAERDQEWIGRTDWRYELEFVAEIDVGAGAPARLVLGGVDTAAGVELNGRAIGRTRNAFTTARFDVGGLVARGVNQIAFTIAAPIALVEREHSRLGRLPHNGDELGWHPFQMLRKPACNFGWDWGPRVATSGVLGGVSLESGRRVGLERKPRVVRLDGERWAVELRPSEGVEVARVSLGGRDGAQLALERAGRVTRAVVREPELWWPVGLGEQRLHEVSATLECDGERESASWRVGFRTAELDTSADEHGSACTLRVNGEAVFCRGANWIPDALFAAESTPDRVRARVRQAVDANMNMLRVWGGGMYERAAFYEACDELGVMVWHDFMFACALYPERELWDRVEEEAREQLGRLAPHPSIVVWSGANECVEGYQHWGWKDRALPESGWGLGLWTELLPRVLGEVDPGRAYLPNSPWSGAVEDVRDPDHGDRHTWDLQFDDVRRIVPRFVSEFGRVAPACERTLWEAGVFEGEEGVEAWPRKAVAMAPGVREALEHRLRQTGGSGVAYDPVLPEHFGGAAADLRGWLWQTQALQARALKTHVEWLRANSPRCMGALIWQINDCWACQSWALIDSGGRPKPAWYQVRRSFEPRLLTIQPMDGDERLSAVLVNDTGGAFEAECVVRRVTLGGDELARAAAPLRVGARAVGRLGALTGLVGEPSDPAGEVLVVEASGMRDVWFWRRDRELDLPVAPLAVSIEWAGDRCAARLEARGLARDVIIAADLLGERARAAENCFTMLAGETRVVEIEGAESELVRAVPVGQVVRCSLR